MYFVLLCILYFDSSWGTTNFTMSQDVVSKQGQDKTRAGSCRPCVGIRCGYIVTYFSQDNEFTCLVFVLDSSSLLHGV